MAGANVPLLIRKVQAANGQNSVRWTKWSGLTYSSTKASGVPGLSRERALSLSSDEEDKEESFSSLFAVAIFGRCEEL